MTSTTIASPASRFFDSRFISIELDPDDLRATFESWLAGLGDGIGPAATIEYIEALGGERLEYTSGSQKTRAVLDARWGWAANGRELALTVWAPEDDPEQIEKLRMECTAALAGAAPSRRLSTYIEVEDGWLKVGILPLE